VHHAPDLDDLSRDEPHFPQVVATISSDLSAG
jgi:hypothetical protein